MRDIQLEYEPISNNLYNQMVASLTSLFINDLEESEMLARLKDDEQEKLIDRRVH